jgi:MFS family permease
MTDDNFQAKGHSASQSGVDIFPYVLGMGFAALAIGILARKTGRYWPLLTSGPILAAIGSGLLYTVTVQTESPKLIGYQILLGAGVGCIFQIPITAVQAEYADRPTMISQATSLQLFFQMLGAVCGIS